MTGWGNMRGCRWGEGQVAVAGYHGRWGQEDSGWWWHIALGHLRWVGGTVGIDGGCMCTSVARRGRDSPGKIGLIHSHQVSRDIT